MTDEIFGWTASEYAEKFDKENPSTYDQHVVAFLEPLVRILAPHPDSHLILRFHYPGMDAAPAADSIRLFAREVAPRLRDAAAS